MISPSEKAQHAYDKAKEHVGIQRVACGQIDMQSLSTSIFRTSKRQGLANITQHRGPTTLRNGLKPKSCEKFLQSPGLPT